MARASARHILVADLQAAESVKEQIEQGSDFAEMARQHSTCPSSQKGGDLGQFGRGQMVAEFDQAVFTGVVGQVQGPVKTQFGYHLIEVTERNE